MRNQRYHAQELELSKNLHLRFVRCWCRLKDIQDDEKGWRRRQEQPLITYAP